MPKGFAGPSATSSLAKIASKQNGVRFFLAKVFPPFLFILNCSYRYSSCLTFFFAP